MPPTVLVNAILGAVLLQIIEVSGVVVITGIGLTVTVAEVLLAQPLALPVIVYVAVPAVLLLLFDKVCAIGVPGPDEPPVIPPPSTTVQV